MRYSSPKTIEDDDMRELNSISKQNLRDDMMSFYEHMLEEIVIYYVDYSDDKNTLRGIASLVRKYFAELPDERMEYLEKLNDR